MNLIMRRSKPSATKLLETLSSSCVLPEYTPAIAGGVVDYRMTFVATGTEKREIQPNRDFIKIRDLGSREYVLIEPVDVILEYLPDETLAIIPELELYGEGATDSEALADLKNELIALFEDLNDIPEAKLGELPMAWKRIVNRMIERV